MQILTGELKGRRFKVPRGGNVRPTSGRVKKSIFDTIGDHDKNAKVLDVFSGSGGLGLEALSRGAEYVVFIEKSKTVVNALNQNIDTLGYKGRASIMGFDYRKALSILSSKGADFDLIFFDPPYNLYERITVENLVELGQNLLAENGMIIIEHNMGNDINIDNFGVRTKKYGETMISFIRREF